MSFHPIRGLRQKLHNDELTIGMMLRSASGELAEIAGFRGLEFLVVDMEHGFPDLTDVRDVVRAADAAEVPVIVRTYSSEPALICRIMDTGALGVMIPHVRTREDAEKAVRAVKYFPDGDRGICPKVRANEYGYGDRVEYCRVANEETIVVVLVEDEDALDNVEAIASTPGVDILWPGMVDLAQGMGLAVDDPAITSATERCIEVARAHGVASYVGLPVNDGHVALQRWWAHGVRNFSWTDSTVFGEAITSLLNGAKAAV